MAKVEVKHVANTKKNLIIFLVAALLAFAFANIAIDRGLVWYFPFLIALFFAIRALIHLIKKR